MLFFGSLRRRLGFERDWRREFVVVEKTVRRINPPFSDSAGNAAFFLCGGGADR
jgi:hypothetical protein